jgi:hypothetical protein
MKFNGYSFPHPVMGLGDDYKNALEAPSLTIDDSDPVCYIITIKYKLENEELNELIKTEQAFFLCEITCTATLFRRAYETNEFMQEIRINKTMLRNKTEILFLITASANIQNYFSKDFNADFSGYRFDFEKGDVLAYFGETDFIAGVSYKKLKAVSSFMIIEKGSEVNGPFNINLDGPKIRIALSANDHEKYSDPRIGRNNKLASTFHSSIVLPSLIHALHRLLKDEGSFEGNSWAQVIKHRIQNELHGVSFEEENIPIIAQKLIDLPLNRLMEDLLEKDLDNNEHD